MFKENIIYIGNIDEKVTDELLWELGIQFGPLTDVKINKDKITKEKTGYGYLEYKYVYDAEYGSKILNGISLYGKKLKISYRKSDIRENINPLIFIGNISENINYNQLNNIFSIFGSINEIIYIEKSGIAKIRYDKYEEADIAIEKMNNQYLDGKKIRVEYGYKDDKGRRYGSKAERELEKSATILGKLNKYKEENNKLIVSRIIE